ncbi:beta-L-arabinofuranosidase domain-containing protein [Galbibacter sp.]|uniref:beta-L-arabinofuranosidase domain-containing protein n=1 Tax=Galbibacter sp. TaxID=2918471 RepID=UPI003A8E8EC6
MKLANLFTLIIWSLCWLHTFGLKAQEGDQILDGIGETALTARYVFDENLRDWSRNNLHAELQGSEVVFADDAVFGKVLSLQSADKNFIKLPGALIGAEESLTISGWFLSDSEQTLSLLDFGVNTKNHFSIGLSKGNLIAEVIADGNQIQTKKQGLKLNNWHHFVVIFNIVKSDFELYVDGKLEETTTITNIALNQVFDLSNTKNNQFYIGQSLYGSERKGDVKLHDFRMYHVALSAQQVERIYHTALQGEAVVNERQENEDKLPGFHAQTPELYIAYLKSVEDIQVRTNVGELPRLPAYLDAQYNTGVDNTKVRVIWPTPEDNHKVQQEGTYTLVGRISGSPLQPKATVTVKQMPIKAPQRILEPFKLSQVRLNKGPHGEQTKFIENRDKFIGALAQTNSDSFLYMFRNAFGVEQPHGAEPLGVWDSQETKLRGHASGHYLSAIAQAYASSTYNKELQDVFAKKMEYMVETLYDLSKLSGEPKTPGGDFVSDPREVPFGPGKSGYDSDLSEQGIRNDYWNWGKGYISAYPPDQFIMLERGATYGGQNDQIWAPYYTLHKILAGLLDIYEISGNKKALVVAQGMGDWVAARIGELPTPTLISMWNRYIAGEYGGMNEVMARLYRLSGTEPYLEVATLFDNIKMFYGDAQHTHGLAKNVDTFRGLHANQHIPQIVGALEMYRDTDVVEYFKIADNFWFKTTHDYMYSIGGVAGARNPANAECFPAQPATLYENGFSSGGQNETCATYNMLKLTRNLFFFEPKAQLMDYYERGLYNHILASVAKDSPANTYHVPLLPGSVKHFGNPDMKGFTCCNGTAIESSTKLQNSIYFKSKDNKSLYVNLFIPSRLDWTQRNIQIDQITSFPNEDHTTLKIKGKGSFELKIRVPSWATNGFYVKINGKEIDLESSPGSYVSINRKWRNGDTIEIRMPFEFRLEPVMDQQNIASLFYGPVLLAAQEDAPRTEWRKVTFDAQHLGKSIQGDPSTLEFNYKGIVFKPFYETYGRHSVYLDVSLD